MNKMFKFNGMPYKRSGRAGGKSVSMIGMLVLLLAALLVLPSCDNETEVEGPATYYCNGVQVTGPDCPEGPGDSDYDVTLEEDDHATADDAYNSGDSVESIAGSPGVDHIYGQGGDDEINGMGGNDVITGGEITTAFLAARVTTALLATQGMTMSLAARAMMNLEAGLVPTHLTAVKEQISRSTSMLAT